MPDGLPTDDASGVYVRRSMTRPSAELLLGWARSVGIAPQLVAEELHVTLCWSKTGFELPPRTDVTSVPTAGASLGYLGPKGALVLRLSSPELTARHEEMLAAGATSEHETYLPHVTLSYGSTVDPALIDLADLPAVLVFGPEVFGRIDHEREIDGLAPPVHGFDAPAPAEAARPETAEHATLQGVEIFRVGRWNGMSYTLADLDKMVSAFGSIGYRPPVKLGHDNDPKAPAYGWVTGLRRRDDVLEADFEDVPSELVEQIRSGRYDAVSSEIFLDYERNGTKYPRALKAVAVLGAHPPGVSDLKPLRASLGEHTTVGRAFACTEYQGAVEMPTPDLAGATAPAAIVDQTEELTAARARIAELEARTTEAAALAEQSGQAALVIRQMQERLLAAESQLAEQRETARRAEVDAIVAQCSVPAFRDHIRALAQVVSSETAPRTVEFATGGEASQPTPPRTVLTDLIEQINRRAVQLFGESATVSTDRAAFVANGGDTQSEVLRLAADYRHRHPSASQSQAIKAVLAMPTNAHLARSYAAN